MKKRNGVQLDAASSRTRLEAATSPIEAVWKHDPQAYTTTGIEDELHWCRSATPSDVRPQQVEANPFGD